MASSLHDETRNISSVVTCEGREVSAKRSLLIAHIERVVAALIEEDIEEVRDFPDSLIIRNSKEFLLIQAHRQRRLEKKREVAQRALRDPIREKTSGTSTQCPSNSSESK